MTKVKWIILDLWDQMKIPLLIILIFGWVGFVAYLDATDNSLRWIKVTYYDNTEELFSHIVCNAQGASLKDGCLMISNCMETEGIRCNVKKFEILK